MSNAGEPPPVPLTRLKALAPAEHALYFDLFLAAGGGPDKPVSAGAVSVLERSRLPSWVLQKIWGFADEYNTGSLDLEGFFVACRLCAHAQQAPDETAAAEVVSDAAAADIPSAPPWFEGYERSEEGAAPRHTSGSAESLGRSQGLGTSGAGVPGSGGNFDFEAAAFGSASAPGSSGVVRPAGGTGLGAMPILPVPGGTEQWQRSSASAGGFHEADAAGTADDTPSAAALAKGLGLRQPEQSASATVAHAAHRRADVKNDPTKRLGEELLEGRQTLEQKFNEKRRLQRRMQKIRKQLEAMRSDREHVVAELTSRQCDVQHMFTQLDFSRQQIEASEREIVHMRAVRQAFTEDDMRRAERTKSRFEQERVSLGEDRHDIKASTQMSQDMLRQDRKNVIELMDAAKRIERRKMELQSKQHLLLEDQRQAEQERGGMLYGLELERVKLNTMRSERLEIGNNAQQTLLEARKLARDTGVEPAVFADCFLPSAPAVSLIPIDPLVAFPGDANGGAWGPAAEHARGREDTAAWKTAVYRTGNTTGEARFSVSGGNVDLTSAAPWAQFGKGAAQKGMHGGKAGPQSHNHYRNKGLLGVPAGQF